MKLYLLSVIVFRKDVVASSSSSVSSLATIFFIAGEKKGSL